ncbi:MAG: aminotransferase class V-fold PLP-dependent enzyme [Cellvibrionaceae bacterium]
MFDPIQFKKNFPLFCQAENQSLVYLDNAATTQTPQCVIDAIAHFYTSANANANRSSHRLARQATAVVEETRKKAADFMGAKSRDEIVFTSGATESLNIIANGVKKTLTASDEVIVSYAEHHANLVPWQEAVKEHGAKLVFSEPDLSDLYLLITNNTKIVSITAASNGLGFVNDLSVLKKIKHDHPSIIIVLDVSQLSAHQSIRVKDLSCDFCVSSPHKFYGPTGIGLLYGKKDYLNRLSPLCFGGEMVNKVGLYNSSYVDGPERFETGTSPLASIAGLNACFDFWLSQDREEMQKYESFLVNFLHEKLFNFCQKNTMLSLLTRPENNIGIAALTIAAPFSLADIAIWLDQHNIALRVGDHCAQPLWQYLNVNKTLRISLCAYNTKADIECLLDCLSHFFDESSFSITSSKTIVEYGYLQCDWNELIRPMVWQKRYKIIMQWGRLLDRNDVIRKDTFLLQGCESNVWIDCSLTEDRYYFSIDSDSNFIKGLAVVLLCRVQAKSAEDIMAVDFNKYFSDLGLGKHLSPTRTNGFHSLVDFILSIVKK